MIHSNTETVPGKRIVQFYGVVTGSTVRAKHMGRDIAAGLKNLVGGELTGYTELLTEARGEAVARMVKEAEALGANAVLNVRFSTSAVTSGAAELWRIGGGSHLPTFNPSWPGVLYDWLMAHPKP